ncbi:MAG: dienelactone hydrolase [Motiliproteus sp.]|jgi:dienelactone hydrolase
MCLKTKLALIVTAFMFSVSVSVSAKVIDRRTPTISYVTFQSVDLSNPEVPLSISGQLRIPFYTNKDADAAQVFPAVVVLHSSGGVDSTGGFYIDALNDSGIATFEIDMWAARGLSGGSDRPALPVLTVPDAFGALRYLTEHSNIDPGRIGVMGFSWGAVVTLLAATESYAESFGNDDLRFAAHVAHYPVCWAYNVGIDGMEFSDLTGKPLLIQVGTLDGYDDGSEHCENLVASLSDSDRAAVSLNVYQNAQHGWDRLQPAITVFDPFSHQGMGGYVELAPNPGRANQSRTRVVRFFRDALSAGNRGHFIPDFRRTSFPRSQRE